MQETWLPIPYEPFGEKYLISNFGRVKPIEKSRYSKNKTAFLNTEGKNLSRYVRVAVYHSGKKRTLDVHRTVLLAFIGKPPQDKPFACHIDGNTRNNRVDNLKWGSPADNMQDKIGHGRSMYGERNSHAKITGDKVRKIRATWANKDMTQTEMANVFGISQTAISKIVLGINWKHIK